MRLQINPRGGSLSCPLCRSSLARGGQVRECSGCEISYHAECLEELGGCGTLGCDRAKRVVAPPRRPARERRAGSREGIDLRVPAILIGLLVFGVATRFVGEDSESARVSARVQRARNAHHAETFVHSVQFLVSFRGSSSEGERRASRDRAERAYEALLKSRPGSPTWIQADLSQRLSRAVYPSERVAAEELAREIFATVDRTPVFQPEVPKREPHSALDQHPALQRASELMAEGRPVEDPEVQRLIQAALRDEFQDR